MTAVGHITPFSLAVLMEAVCTSETSVYFSETARRYIPEDSQLHTPTERHSRVVSTPV
jgi:hypothetical protein